MSKIAQLGLAFAGSSLTKADTITVTERPSAMNMLSDHEYTEKDWKLSKVVSTQNGMNMTHQFSK